MPRSHRPKIKSGAELEAECIVWNHKHPIGTPVLYRSVTGYKAGETLRWPPPMETKTRSEAYVLSGHTAVVFVEGVAGCVALDACEVIGCLDA